MPLACEVENGGFFGIRQCRTGKKILYLTERVKQQKIIKHIAITLLYLIFLITAEFIVLNL